MSYPRLATLDEMQPFFTPSNGQTKQPSLQTCISMSPGEMMKFLSGPSGREKAFLDKNGNEVVAVMNKVCGACNKGYGLNPVFPEGGKKCARCKQVHYCNRECQRAHWKTHKPNCKELKKDLELAKQVKRRHKKKNKSN